MNYKKYLKTGVFGYVDGETNDWFVVAGEIIVYQNGSWDEVCDLNENLVFPSGRKITALYKTNGFNNAARFKSTLIWERNTLYNGKVVCVDTCGNDNYTVGKIYQFEDGNFKDDTGELFPDENTIYSFDDWARWSSAKWIEIKE